MKSTVSKATTKFGNEASRRLYRGAADAARKLEQRLGMGSSLTELFSSEITDLRIRLKDFCERLIFTDPVEYGKKAEDLLWRKVYYDFFFRCKQNRKKFMESEYHRSCVKSHLLAGIGFYYHLLLRIQTEFHLNLEGRVNVPLLWHLKGVKKERWKRYQESAASDDIRNWAEQASHRILIYLGDLERYIAELDEIESHHLAERYYQQAFCLNSQNGTPHNQLGSLYNNRFDSAYHYMRCLACYDKFDGAENNLMRVFEKNEEVMQKLYSSECINKESLKCSRFLSRFLKLCQMFYFKRNESFSPELYCQDILKEFDITLNCNELDIENPLLSDDMIFKVVVMTLMCVLKLQERDASDASVATAFCIALFSYVLQRTIQHLLMSVYELKSNALPQNDSEIKNVRDIQKPLNGSHLISSRNQQSDGSGDIENTKDNLAKKTSAKKLCLKKFSVHRLRTLRRRRKVSSTSQEDSELSEGEMPESDEESAILNSDASQTSSDSLSENDDDLLIEENLDEDDNDNNEVNLQNGVNEIVGNGKFKEAAVIDEKNCSISIENILNDSTLSSDKLTDALKKNGLLPCLKILSDWLRINEDILSACIESSQFLLSCLIQFLNILLKIDDRLSTSNEQYLSCNHKKEAWVQEYPLPEDTALQSFPLLKDIHNHISFDVAKRRELSTVQQVYLRLQCLSSFGKCLTKLCNSSVEFDADKKRYCFNLCNRAKESNKDESGPSKPAGRDAEGQKQYLMRSMAHLWLKAEVHDLESIVAGDSAPQLSPYLVADTSVLCSNLPALKQLVNAKRFIVVVPLVVIASLDQLKKESIGAREAIRWLESELQKGCRYIRAQRQVEKISLIPMKYPKKKEKEAWDLFQVLECCNYLVQLQSNGKSNSHLVTLLVSSLHHLPDNAIGLAHSIDVKIESLASFLSKWRTSSKKPG